MAEEIVDLSTSSSEENDDLEIVCYPCEAVKIPCDPVCVLTPLFTLAESNRFFELLEYFGDELELFKATVKRIPPQYRLTWVELGPLPKPIPFPNDVATKELLQKLPLGKPCFPCWVIEPNASKICIGCPLSGYFSEDNLEVLEFFRLAHGGNLQSLKDEISFFEVESFGGVEVQNQIQEKIDSIWEDALVFAADYKRNAREEKARDKGKHVLVEEVGVEVEKVVLGARDKGKAVVVDVEGVEVEEIGRQDLTLIFTNNAFLQTQVYSKAMFEKIDSGSDVRLINMIICAAKKISCSVVAPEGDIVGLDDTVGLLEASKGLDDSKELVADSKGLLDDFPELLDDFPHSGPILRLMEEALKSIVAARERVKNRLGS